MELVRSESIAEYLTNDTTARRLNGLSLPGDESLICQTWLRESQAKRFIFEQMYGSLFETDSRSRILDVGGGLTSLTRGLAGRHDYTLVDLLAHGEAEKAASIAADVGIDFVKSIDWQKLTHGTYDLVLANDLFPNVDQRLEMFLERFLPCARKIRMSLTYYDNPRFYMTRRVDADEILCMLAWSGEHLSSVLRKYSEKIVHADFDVFSRAGESVFANGRQVCLVEFSGGLEEGVVQ